MSSQHANSKHRKLFYTYLAICAIFESCLAFGQRAPADRSIWISGSYSYIFSNGEPPKTTDYQFTAVTAANEWSISITNISQPREWGIMRSDGTNIYTLSTDTLNNFKVFGHAFFGPFYVPVNAIDSVRGFFPWMVFHLKPQMILDAERQGAADMPAPWGKRHSLIDFGFRWETSYFEEGRIVQRIDVVRDSSLDLKTVEEELRRAGVNYPFEYSATERRLEALQIRKTIPNGFVRAIYECGALYKTNEWIVPSSARFAMYWPNYQDRQGPSRLVYEMRLTVDKVNIIQNENLPELISPSSARVWDYRYEVATARTKFNCAEYTLNPGDPFPASNDPKLLAQANEWLKRGPAYDHLKSRRIKILAGMFAVTILGIGLLAFWLSRKRTTHKQTK
ncbi:MAG TPA: hypothetical protein VFZ59_07875 [Verrucomicrobiae bacterium]|nr:hypothetical protein [Verrucomicrobiae bacterium]